MAGDAGTKPCLSHHLGRSRQVPIISPVGRSFDRSAIRTTICAKFPFGMGWVDFNHGESGLFTAVRTRVLEAVLNAHVTSFPQGLKSMSASQLELNPAALTWRRGRFEGCSFMRQCRGENSSRQLMHIR